MADKEPTICIIEDNPEDRAILRRYLLEDIDYRYHFFEEESGEQGIELCRRVKPDCILIDYNLPDINGIEFLQSLADDSGSIPFPAIILTGVGDDKIAIEAMKKGAQDYLVKDDMTPGSLFRAIHNAIERAALLRTTEKQRRDLELKNQEIQAFAFALAHDLRAPLRAISGFAQIIDREYGHTFDHDGKRYLNHIVHASSQMDQLIEELLNYTRIEHRRILSKPVALAPLLQEILESIGPRINETRASISVSTDLPIVLGDAMLLKQIFMNLLENALTYHKPGTPPAIKVIRSIDNTDSSDAIICVEDNGIGITEKHHEKIFNIFQRLHSYDEYPGTGIGLAIVRKSIDLLDGQIWVESALDEGSRFFLKLRLAV